MAQQINVGVSSWIIQDGNYKDFQLGQIVQCALEFWAPERLRPARPQSPSAHPAGAELYNVTAEIVFCAPEVWVLDAGIRVYRQEAPPENLETGTFVQGTVAVGIDPCFYREYLHDLPGMPKLSYDLLVDQISLETTPWVTISGVKQRKSGVRTFASVERTNAWSDDGGHAHYVLACRLTGE